MRRISYSSLAFVVPAVALLWSTAAFAGDGRSCPGNTPNPNAANIALRVFNDCPTSTVTVVNTYPANIVISDSNIDCFGFANLHTWSFSTDGGLTEAVFENCSYYRFCADVFLDGNPAPPIPGDPRGGECGLRLSPWFGKDTDGKFMLNVGTGEIACFGGRLPFYSFTVNFGVHYTLGTPAHMEILYNPHTLSASDPATIIYTLQLGAGPLMTSGPLAFDQGNAAEDPPHGLWGELVPAYAGGYFQPRLGAGFSANLTCTWRNICYENLGTVPTTPTTWGRIKTMYR